MIKRIFLGLLAGLFLFGVYEYQSAPVFWQRFTAMLVEMDAGAYSTVFTPYEEISAPAIYDIRIAQEKTISDDALQSVVSYAQEYNSYGLLVIHKGLVQLEWYNAGYDKNSLTQSQSMHKTLQALLIGIAIEEGKIKSVSEPMSNYLSEWSGDSRDDITIEHGLRMTTGLRNSTQSFNPWGESFRWLYAEDSVSATLQHPQVIKAGEVFDYNDYNAQALGILLGRAVGQRYSQYLQEKVWGPMGGQVARVWVDREGGEAMHACCLLATVRDWARIGMMFANGGVINGNRIVSQDWINQMVNASDITPHYGYQVWLGNNELPNPRVTGYQRTELWLADDVLFLSGYGAQRVYVSPDNELVVVRLGPSAGYFPRISGGDWDNAYLFNTLVRGIKD